MKIEKISDTQIKCTLNKEDLLHRELRISELAYGSEKAKELFREMMQQASYEFGFEAEDIPLMIEAIPISQDCLVLVITKVEDPDELDTRFSNFTPFTEKEDFLDEVDDNAYADELLNCCEQMSELFNSHESSGDESDFDDNKQLDGETSKNDIKAHVPYRLIKIYSFTSLNEVVQLAKIIHSFYHGENTLYKEQTHARYYLAIHMSKHTPEEFNKICNIISEYGKTERTNYATIAYYEEHLTKIVSSNALQVLAEF